MDSDLPKIFGQDPLTLLAEHANPAMIHRWIDALYERDFENDHTLMLKLTTVAALIEHTKTYPLNSEYHHKLECIAEIPYAVGEEALAQLQVTHA